MAQDLGTAPSVRVRRTIRGEKDIYVCVDEETCFAKFAYENRPENQEIRDTITAVCDAVTIGLQRLKERACQQ